MKNMFAIPPRPPSGAVSTMNTQETIDGAPVIQLLDDPSHFALVLDMLSARRRFSEFTFADFVSILDILEKYEFRGLQNLVVQELEAKCPTKFPSFDESDAEYRVPKVYEDILDAVRVVFLARRLSINSILPWALYTTTTQLTQNLKKVKQIIDLLGDEDFEVVLGAKEELPRRVFLALEKNFVKCCNTVSCRMRYCSVAMKENFWLISDPFNYWPYPFPVGTVLQYSCRLSLKRYLHKTAEEVFGELDQIFKMYVE